MLRDNFCSSPWYHIRIDPAGNYLPCRWSSKKKNSDYNITNTTIQEYINSPEMRNFRLDLLNGNVSKNCNSCYYQDTVNKVSGRHLQLLKSAIKVDNFEKSLCASPHYTLFEHSYNNQGYTNYHPVDFQIDLGNTCNSACIMCSPKYSSKLASEYKKLHKIEPELFAKFNNFKNWPDDPTLVDKFVNEIAQIPDIKYIHLLGGETLYLPGFYNICNKLIELDIAKNVSIGTTTNGTVYTQELENIIKQFKHVHLGISIESFHSVNDYIRWPYGIEPISKNIQRLLKLRDKTNLHVSLRITPNILSIYHIDTIFEFMIKNNVIAESCNILHDPSCLRMELLPQDIIDATIGKIDRIINKYNLKPNDHAVINKRRDDLSHLVISDVIFEYRNFLQTYKVPENLESERYSLVRFIKAFESIRKNNILTYLPEYEEFLRSYGY